MHVGISWEGGERRLAAGRYVIGRHPACDIVLDQATVSPRHAELAVGGSTVILFDLRSASGVFVNDERVRQSRPLAAGDRIRIGSTEIQLTIRETRESGATRKAASPLIGRRSSFPPRSVATTARDQALAVIAGLADRAMAAGRISEAESMLTPRLRGILQDARSGVVPSEATCDAATRCALQLARATGDGRWIEYVIELLDVRRSTLSDSLASEICETLARVRSIDPRVLRRYTDTLRGLGRSIERIRSLHNTERLMDLAGRRRA